MSVQHRWLMILKLLSDPSSNYKIKAYISDFYQEYILYLIIIGLKHKIHKGGVRASVILQSTRLVSKMSI